MFSSSFLSMRFSTVGSTTDWDLEMIKPMSALYCQIITFSSLSFLLYFFSLGCGLTSTTRDLWTENVHIDRDTLTVIVSEETTPSGPWIQQCPAEDSKYTTTGLSSYLYNQEEPFLWDWELLVQDWCIPREHHRKGKLLWWIYHYKKWSRNNRSLEFWLQGFYATTSTGMCIFNHLF